MLRTFLIATAFLGLPGALAAAPERVVSMNLCTDQLAMLIGPEQLISVSYLAQEPRSSVMAEEAKAYPANRGLAEEVFLLRPDLVIAGTYTTRATVDMLGRLGIPVIEFAPANSLEDVRARVARMGSVLEREESAARLIAQFDADLAAAKSSAAKAPAGEPPAAVSLPGEAPADDRPRAATYYANSYTSGGGTLASDVMDAAGLANLAIDLGLDGGGRLPLESLVMAAPDLIVSAQRFDSPALAEAVLSHPALRHVQAQAGAAPVADRDWICGTPFIIAAVRRLVQARDAVLAR